MRRDGLRGQVSHSTVDRCAVSGDGQGPLQVNGIRWQLDPEVTIGRAIVAAAQRLGGAGVDSPRLDAEVLLGHVLGMTRAQLYAHADRRLSEEERRRFEALVGRRCLHEPVAYLVGRKAFYGLDLLVTPHVLIPRPETELLVDLALDTLAHRSRSASGNGAQPQATLADVGTGSGAVALAVAANNPHVQILATDISAAALEVAQENARRLGLEDRVRFLRGHLLEPLPQPVDLIVANLPYVAESEWPSLAPDIANYEPALALAGGPDGLSLIRDLLAQAPRYLLPGGSLFLEIGSGQGAAVARLASAAFPSAYVEVLTDYAYHDRVVAVRT
ncbi:MAG: peptide chain release factor N(5)-glutamine methyltransferase [Caldilineales bacterium]|nr:peptide chain release factor N(5)-glutamine methyltransferase [Caldilineales bacterium]MDW8317569.1 peptide chain release factor N(5)-glutamine methyltransferase [Anaerolineae bacterium]